METSGVIGGPPLKEFKMIINKPLVLVPPVFEKSFSAESSEGLSWKKLGLAVGSVYALLFVLILGSIMLLPNQGNVVAPVTATVEKVGVPIIPEECSSAIDNADTAVSQSARLNAASGEYIRAQRSGDKKRIKAALVDIREARAAFTGANPAFVADRDECIGDPTGIDISLTQAGLNG